METISAKTYYYGDRFGNTRLGFTTAIENEREANIRLSPKEFQLLINSNIDEVDNILSNIVSANKKTKK